MVEFYLKIFLKLQKVSSDTEWSDDNKQMCQKVFKTFFANVVLV